jgi:hypothetical protein
MNSYHNLTITFKYQQVAAMIKAGHSYKEIASATGMSLKQVRNQRRHAVNHGLLVNEGKQEQAPHDDKLPLEKEPWPTGMWFEDEPRAARPMAIYAVRLG